VNARQPVALHGIRAAIIDLDGTMVDTAPDFQVAINRMRAELGLAPLDIDTIKRFVGKGTENLILRVLGEDYAAEEIDLYFNRALDAYTKHYLEINGKYSSIYTGVDEGLEALRAKGLRLACVTNKPVAFALPLLEQTGLRRHFELVYGGDSLPTKKPDPRPLLQVCTDFGVRPAQAVAIGDSSNDARAARAAGCYVLTVPYGYNHGEPVQEIDSDGIVPTLRDAADLISASSHP
jgi:phosphoglycolate phosphatase